MSATVITGNILDAKTKYIAHQTNCVTQKAAHLSAAVFQRFPYADIYSVRPKGQIDEPGNIVIRGDGYSERFVINMLAQVYPGKPKFPDSPKDGYKARQRYFFYCLKDIANIPDLDSITFPYGIGCGAAGGNWDFYHGLIDKFAKHLGYRADVFIFKLPEVGA